MVENRPLQSPAKINLLLRVGPRREDGFHSLLSWFSTVGLADVLELELAPAGVIRLTCDHPQVPCDERNLVIKAARLLAGHCGTDLGMRAHLQKRIPMGGGLGGGSSNAAAALTGLTRLWNCQAAPDVLDNLAAQLGSDVPFFLHPPSAICRGRGEIITPAPPPTPQAVLLILPAIAMPTPAVYSQFDEMAMGTDLQSAHLPPAGLAAMELLPWLVNDLEPPAFALSPELGYLRDRCQAALQRPVRMSGSGSTLFTLYDEAEEADQAGQILHRQFNVSTHACNLGRCG